MLIVISVAATVAIIITVTMVATSLLEFLILYGLW